MKNELICPECGTELQSKQSNIQNQAQTIPQ